MDRKTPISFDFQNYVEKQCDCPKHKNATTLSITKYDNSNIVLDLIEFFENSKLMIEKRTGNRLKKELFYICEKYCTD